MRNEGRIPPPSRGQVLLLGLFTSFPRSGEACLQGKHMGWPILSKTQGEEIGEDPIPMLTCPTWTMQDNTVLVSK